MKKKVLLFVFVLISITSLFASDFEFSFFGSDTLYKESVFDPYGFESKFILMVTPDYRDRNFDVRAIVKDQVTDPNPYYKDFSYYWPADETKRYYYYANLKFGTSFPLVQLRYTGWKYPLEGEVAFGAYLNSVFCLFESSLNLGYDGSYFIGASLRFDGKYTIRGGMHHLPGHYGDEMLKRINTHYVSGFKNNKGISYIKLSEYDNKNSASQWYSNDYSEYVRDNTWNIAASAELPAGFRFYASVDFPMYKTIIRPFVHNPAGYKSKIVDLPLSERTAIDENFDSDFAKEYEATMKNTDYYALIAHSGVEWTKKLSFADLVLGFDIYAHQDGQTLHKVGGYSKNNPWDFEFTAGVSLEFSDAVGSHDVCFTAQYHYGRPPLLNFYYKNPTNYIYIGAVLR